MARYHNTARHFRRYFDETNIEISIGSSWFGYAMPIVDAITMISPLPRLRCRYTPPFDAVTLH